MRDEQIEMSVAVVVHPGASGAPALSLLQKAGFPRHIGESAVPIVAIEDVLPPSVMKMSSYPSLL